MTLYRTIAAATLSLAALTLAACQSQTEEKTADASEPGICRADAAAALVGRNAVTDAEAMKLTGAGIVRQLAPGQGATMDYRRERVTVVTDPKTKKITQAMCG